MRIRVLAIAPYPGLRDLLQQTAAEDDQIDLDIEIADLQEAIPLIKERELSNYDAVISRGGTAALLRTLVTVPVIDIPVSGYDMLRALTLLKESASDVAIIGFPNICQSAGTVSNLMEIDFPTYRILDENDVPEIVKQAVKNGARLILGDVVTVRTAQECGVPGILLTSGKESVQTAVEDVKHICQALRRKNEEAGLMKALLEREERGIFAIDLAGTIIYCNKTAAEWLHSDPDFVHAKAPDELWRQVEPLVDSEKRVPSWQGSLSLSGKSFDAKAERVSLKENHYLAVYLKPQEARITEKRDFQLSSVKFNTFAQIIGRSDTIRKVVEQAKAFAASDQNIWITGGPGSGKTLFAAAIHFASGEGNRPLYRISCRNLKQDEHVLHLFGTPSEPGALEQTAEASFFLDDADQLPIELQLRLLEIVYRNRNVRLISASNFSLADCLQRGNLLREAGQLLAEAYLRVPDLAERVEDIDEIATVRIAAHNMRYGKQIVGMRDEVASLLKSHSWPGNVREFEDVLESMLLLTKGHFVELEDANSVWQRYQSDSAKQISQSAVELVGTLEEIERNVILQVLKEEGMHQSNAARRLGINRSTLWRKLKDTLQN